MIRLRYLRVRRAWFGRVWQLGWRWPVGTDYNGSADTARRAAVQAARALRRGPWG